MKKTLLATALISCATLSHTTINAESFSGFFLIGKGGAVVYNNASLPDLAQTSFGNGELKDYGGFGLKGFTASAGAGYSMRFANNLVLGFGTSAGYKHTSVKEEINAEDSKQLGVDFITSTGTADASFRIGMAFGRFHVFLDPTLGVDFSNPEATVYYNGDGAKTNSKKIQFATDKGPDWQQRLYFSMGLNSEYAVTQNVFVGGRIGVRYSFADVKEQKGNFDTDAMKDSQGNSISAISDLAYKGMLDLEIGVYAGSSF